MDNKYEQAVIRSLEASGQFTQEQREALARAIRQAIDKIAFDIIEVRHSHVLEETDGHTHKIAR